MISAKLPDLLFSLLNALLDYELLISCDNQWFLGTKKLQLLLPAFVTLEVAGMQVDAPLDDLAGFTRLRDLEI